MAPPATPPGTRAARIHVGLVDDDPHFLLYLGTALNATTRHRVVATATTAAEALRWPKTPRVHVALIDIGLPDRPGSQIVGEFLARLPDTLVIMLTASADDEAVLDSIRAGAAGYLLKGARESE